jgi:hypothetical protein
MRVLRTRWRYLVVLHPALMTLSIIATANHWWIDAAAAAVIILGAIAAWRFAAAWVGDRTWSWTAMRFHRSDQVAEIQRLADAPPPIAPAVAIDPPEASAEAEGRPLERID